MISITVTYDAAIPYNAASIDVPTTNVNEALNYAFRYTQNTDGSWSNKIGSDANENVTVLHYLSSGSGLRSSSVGDTFTVWYNDKKFKKFKCMPIGFEEVA